MSDHERNDLTFLRTIRDRSAEELILEFGDGWFSGEPHSQWIEDMTQWEYGHRAYHNLVRYCEQNRYEGTLQRLEGFWIVCQRIAKLERQRLGAYIPSNLVDA